MEMSVWIVQVRTEVSVCEGNFIDYKICVSGMKLSFMQHGPHLYGQLKRSFAKPQVHKTHLWKNENVGGKS
jgi:hypothetical protein